MPSKLTQEQVIQQFKQTHGNLYDYSKVNYLDNLTEVTIICKEHGEFKQAPSLHKKGHGCQKCKSEKTSIRVKHTLNKFIDKSNLKHNYKYDYSDVNYKGSFIKVDIICPIHGKFRQEPRHHYNHGCKECAKVNLTQKFFDKPTKLYYIEFILNKLKYYKIGITTQSIEDRHQVKTLYSILYVKQFETGKEAYELEQSVLHRFKSLRYNGVKIMEDGGDTELFVKDVSKIDNYISNIFKN